MSRRDFVEEDLQSIAVHKQFGFWYEVPYGYTMAVIHKSPSDTSRDSDRETIGLKFTPIKKGKAS